MADSVAVMDRGRVLMHVTLAEVYQRPADLVVARFVGDLVELPGTKVGVTVETALGVFRPAARHGRGSRLLGGARPCVWSRSASTVVSRTAGTAPTSTTSSSTATCTPWCGSP